MRKKKITSLSFSFTRANQMLNRVKLLVKIIEIVSLLSSFSLISSFGSTHLKVGGDGRVTPPPSFLLFNVPFPLTHEPLKVNIKCILPAAFLVFILLHIIFFNRRIRKPFPPRSFFMIHTLFVSSFQKHSSHLCFILQKLSRRSRWMCFFFFLSKQVDFFLKCAARAQELI
jgi:hypothetical protein